MSGSDRGRWTAQLAARGREAEVKSGVIFDSER
jgi:hypothetical protein